MASLREDISAFERMKSQLEAEHFQEWVVFYGGELVATCPDFESAATVAVDRYDTGPYLIRQVGAGDIQLPGGMVFRPAHALDSSGL